MQVIVVLPSCCPDVGEMLSKHHADEKRDNRKFFYFVKFKILREAGYSFSWRLR